MDEQKTTIQKPDATVADYTNEINAMYDAQRQQQTQNLENAYNQNLSTLQQSKEQIAPTYFNQGNDLATQYERTRRNNNMRADMNGLNTGAASQMDLAQQSNYLSSYGQIRAAQANAERQADRQIADLELNYKSAVAQALADNDYQRAAALLSEYKRRDEAAKEEQRYQYQISIAEQQYQDQLARQQEQDAFAKQQYEDQLARQQEQDAFTKQQYETQLALNDAKQKAAYGDFSGFASLYGQETADAMKQFWAMNNPDYAYSMGLITAEQYEQMTGYPPDRSTLYSGSSSGSGSSGGSSYRRSGGGGGSGGSPETGGPGTYNPDVESEAGSNAAELTTEQALRIAAGVVGGDISQSKELQSAYRQYHLLRTDAYNAVKSSGVDPNSEDGKALMDRYIELKYSDQNVSLDDIKSLETNRANNAQTAAVTGKAKREAQYGKAGKVTYDWNAEQTGAQAAASAASASKYTPPATTGTVSAGTRTPGATGMSPTKAAAYAVTQNLPALQQLWNDTKAAISGNKTQSNTSTSTTAKNTTTKKTPKVAKPNTAVRKTASKTAK